MNKGVLILLAIVAFLVFSIAQIYAGFIGIEHHLGVILACIALYLAFFKRLTLPLTIGAFFGAMNVWGWSWYWAILFAAPSLALVVPGVLTSLILRAQNIKIVGISSKWK